MKLFNSKLDASAQTGAPSISRAEQRRGNPWKKQCGLGAVQVLLGLTMVVGASFVAVPKYESFVAKSKIQEGFTLATDSRAKLSEFYITKGRFPRSESERGSIVTQSLTPPEFVREILIDFEDPKHGAVIKIFFKDGVLTSDIGPEDYVYIAGNESSVPGALMEWECGGRGIHYNLLPSQCLDD